MTPKKPTDATPAREPAPDAQVDERPAGFVEDAPSAFDDDESDWAEEHAKRADTDNPALAEARKRLRALLGSDAEREPKSPKKS